MREANHCLIERELLQNLMLTPNQFAIHKFQYEPSVFSSLVWTNELAYTCGLYYKTITIVIMMIVSDATIWSVTFDAARGVIYDRNMAIPHVYGTGVICDDRQMTIVIVL